MAADAWSIYDTFREYMGDGTIDMDTDEFWMALFLSTSNCNADDVGDKYADLTNEHATSGGYTQPGQACTATITNANQWLRTTVSVKFDCDDIVWTASGGGIVCRYAVIYDTTPVAPADPLVCWSLLDNGPANITVTAGNTLTITINAAGVFTLTGG
jgi:hypothetical protein